MVEVIRVINCPFTSVTPPAGERFEAAAVPDLDPLAPMLTEIPSQRFPFASFSVSVKSALEVPSATILELELATRLELAKEGAPAINLTFPPSLTMGSVMLRVFTSAFLDLIEQVESPELSDEVHTV